MTYFKASGISFFQSEATAWSIIVELKMKPRVVSCTTCATVKFRVNLRLEFFPYDRPVQDIYWVGAMCCDLEKNLSAPTAQILCGWVEIGFQKTGDVLSSIYSAA